MERDGFVPGRENRLILTVFQDEAETQPEDLTGRTFSVTVFDPRNPEVALATALDGNVIVNAPLTGVIEIVFAPSTFNQTKSPSVQYVVDDITVPATPKKFLPPDEIPIVRMPPAAVPA